MKNWKADYAEKMRDPRWQRKRLEVFQRDDFTCLDCGNKEATLHVHHCLYRLCEGCHELRASIEHDVKLAFARLLALLDRDQMENLMGQILNAQLDGVENGAVVMSADMYSMESEVRWFQKAANNPQFRECYDSVTGSKTDWGKIF